MLHLQQSSVLRSVGLDTWISRARAAPALVGLCDTVTVIKSNKATMVANITPRRGMQQQLWSSHLCTVSSGGVILYRGQHLTGNKLYSLLSHAGLI